jgi:uncharacterized protein YfcZ (UPF0381/DUF406 family)
MKRFYFDIREGDKIIPDEEGLELSKKRRLARWRGDEIAYEIAIEVRDESGPVLQAKFTFEVSAWWPACRKGQAGGPQLSSGLVCECSAKRCSGGTSAVPMVKDDPDCTSSTSEARTVR